MGLCLLWIACCAPGPLYRARIVSALRWEFESRRAFAISSRSARMTAPHPTQW
jgi:hypothetical protein